MMKSIKLIQLTLRYFKGIKEQTITFDPNTTNIYGENATGKSTIFDAFTWLLFGKDSQGRSDSNFDIKTIDNYGNIIPKVEHEVSAILIVDDYKLNLKRVLREKWETKRGTSIPVFTGNETVCEFDEVPVSITEYNKKIAGLVDENLFKLITNPLYFNSLNWKDRRNVIIGLTGEITNNEVFDKIASPKNDYFNLINWLNQGKSIDDLKTKTAQQKKAIKQQLEQIPTRIDEVGKGMPETESFDLIETQISNLKNEVSEIDNQISDRSKAIQCVFDEIQKKRTEINLLQAKQNEIIQSATKKEFERSVEANKVNADKLLELDKQKHILNQLERELNLLSNDLYFSQRITDLNNQIAVKRKEFETVNEREYTPVSEHLICPLYKHRCNDNSALAKFADNSSSLVALFNQEKIETLEKINRDGMSLSEQKKEAEKKIDEQNSAKLELKSKIEAQKRLVEKIHAELSAIPVDKENEIIPSELPDWAEIDKEITKIKMTIREPEPIDNAELINKKSELNAEIDDLKVKLNNKQIIENSEARIVELDKEQSKLAQQLADLDKTEFEILEFTKAKMNEVDKRVNGMFNHVQFRMFETQINGGEAETCETLINTNGSWVPYTTAGNTAGQINAGIDIINTLCKQNGITAPIFIDNRESVNQLIPTPSQIINLIVSTDKKITVK